LAIARGGVQLVDLALSEIALGCHNRVLRFER
jgi:hypothetical protein